MLIFRNALDFVSGARLLCSGRGALMAKASLLVAAELIGREPAEVERTLHCVVGYQRNLRKIGLESLEREVDSYKPTLMR